MHPKGWSVSCGKVLNPRFLRPLPEFPHGGVTTKIHDYYDVIDVNLYSCTLCQKQVKASTSANLLLHFRTTHQAAYDEYLKLSGKRKKRRTEEHRVEKYRVSELFKKFPSLSFL